MPARNAYWDRIRLLLKNLSCSSGNLFATPSHEGEAVRLPGSRTISRASNTTFYPQWHILDAVAEALLRALSSQARIEDFCCFKLARLEKIPFLAARNLDPKR